jgi:hypothetical protein
MARFNDAIAVNTVLAYVYLPMTLTMAYLNMVMVVVPWRKSPVDALPS